MRAIMISGRTLAQGANCESKMSEDFFKAASSCHLSKEDYDLLGLSDGKNILLKNEFGKTVLSPRVDDGLRKGIVFVPMGPWANILIGPDTGGCGTPQFKGVEIDIEATNSPIMDIRELFGSVQRAEA
ncbi:MAG: molybdopterin dinucleotide-binding protein [Methanothrix sp.]|nr:molybdopterin dinucleotide-binding protein [Methanothrix sp.]